ncbi:MAG: hypothetical protein FWC93_03395 [Defluviitaleaceae bacterium]|nr:hypothetical protein [Defluviitaleaceae bacterium]
MPIVNIAGLRVLVDAEENRVQIDDITEKDAEGVWRQVRAEYPGFAVDFGFLNTLAPIDFLKSIGAEVAKDYIELRLAREDLIDVVTKEAVAIDEGNFAVFAALHDAKNPDMCWHSERLRKHLAGWGIFGVFCDGEITGYALVRRGYEIYCVVADGIEDKVALIGAAAKQVLADGHKEVLFMVDRNDYLNLGAALHLGFRRAGYYIGYRVQL